MCSTYLSNNQIRAHHTKPWPTSLAPNLRPHHLQFNCSSCFLNPSIGSSLLYIDLCLKIRSRLSSVTTRSSNYIFLEVPSVCLHQSFGMYGIVFKVPSRMFQAWTQLKSYLYRYIMSFQFCVVLFAFSGIYFDFICFLYCILRFACILRKRRFINADIVLYYCLVVGSHYSWKKRSFWGRPSDYAYFFLKSHHPCICYFRQFSVRQI